MNGEEELPEGWAETTLGAVCDLQSGVGFPLDQQGKKGLPYPFFKVGNLGEVASGAALFVSDHTVDDKMVKALKARVLPPGSVVFAKIGMAIRLNRRRLLGVPACIDNNAMAAVPSASVESRYLLRYLETVDLMPMTQSTTVPSLRKSDLNNISFPLAPLPEQHRIVEQVEALLAQVNKAKDRLDRVKLILTKFRQAVLAAACSGRLTEEWRSEHPELDPALRTFERLKSRHEPFGTDKRGNAAPPDDEAHDLDASVLPSTWICTELLWLCEPGRPITYGILKPGPNQDGGVPYVRVADFPAGVIKVAGVHRTTKKIAEAYKRSTLRTGDVLLSIRGTYGRICVVPPELNGANITQDTARLSIHELVNAAYIVMYLRSQPVQNRIKRAAKGVAVHGVNIGDVRALQVALPPLEEQVEIVRRVDALLTVADVIEARLATASSRAGKLPQSILSKAFRGELVPTEAELARGEGRTFETAEEMLRRVKECAGTKDAQVRRTSRRCRR